MMEHTLSTWVLVLYGLLEVSQGALKDYCFPNVFNATCGPHDVINIRAARYGRMKEGQCLSSTLHVGCWANVQKHVDRKCSGRHDCIINIPDTNLQNMQPCPKDMFAYLEADFECLPIAYNPEWSCHHMAELVVPGPSGYLASITTVETDLGSRSCPWKIRVAQGQRINVTLWDYGIASRVTQSGSMCQVYAKIREEGMASDITICAGQDRERGVFVSESNQIEVVMLTTHPVNYVLKYDVIGCTDPVVPPGAWLKRSGEKAVIGCNHTTQAWHIVCHGNDWFGNVDNCTKGAEKSHSDGLASSKGEFPYGLMVAVITGLVLGVLIGVALLAMVIVCHKRKRRRGTHAPVNCPDAAMETVQGTPFLRDNKPHKPPEALDGGYGYTHVCDVTIYQPYTQQRQMSTFGGGATDLTKPALEAEAQQRHDYEKPGLRKTSISGPVRDQRFYPDFVETDHNVNISPVHKIVYPTDSKLNMAAEH